jgi:uncharacterized protein YuzE
MTITYHKGSDLLYICLDESAREVVNKDVSESVVLELGEGDRIVGIEIPDASRRMDLSNLLTLQYAEVAPKSRSPRRGMARPVR